jgi:hypothetical protein
MLTGMKGSISQSNLEYVEAIRNYTRSDDPTEPGAMKEFKLRDDEVQIRQPPSVSRQGHINARA